MDKKNTTIGVLLLLAAFAVIYFSPRSAPPPRQTGGEKTPAAAPGTTVVPPAGLPGLSRDTPPPASAVNAAFAAVNAESADAVITTLRNDYIEARFTDSGGALREVALIKRDDKGRLIYPDILGSNN